MPVIERGAQTVFLLILSHDPRFGAHRFFNGGFEVVPFTQIMRFKPLEERLIKRYGHLDHFGNACAELALWECGEEMGVDVDRTRLMKCADEIFAETVVDACFSPATRNCGRSPARWTCCLACTDRPCSNAVRLRPLSRRITSYNVCYTKLLRRS